jgi:hypothetical protein
MQTKSNLQRSGSDFRNGVLGLSLLAASCGAQARLLANQGELASGALVAGFDNVHGSMFGNLRASVSDLPGVSLGVQAHTLYASAAPWVFAHEDWPLGSNGRWTVERSYVGAFLVGDRSYAVANASAANAAIYAGLVFDFGGQTVSQVGAIINYNPDFTYGAGFALPLYLAAYDTRGELIDSHEVQFSTPGGVNEGRFYGISVPGATIARFEVAGPYAVVDNLSFTTPVPDASAWMLAGAGLLVLRWAALARVQRRRA